MLKPENVEFISAPSQIHHDKILYCATHRHVAQAYLPKSATQEEIIKCKEALCLELTNMVKETAWELSQQE